MKVFSEEKYLKSIEDLKLIDYNNTRLDQDLINQCRGQKAELGEVIGKDGKKYPVSNTWLEDVKKEKPSDRADS